MDIFFGQKTVFSYIGRKRKVMGIFNIAQKKTKPAALTTTGIFFILTVIYFTVTDIPHLITLPLASLFIASLWLCPWQMCIALLCSATGDYMGSCSNFLGQMGFFALAHIFMATYFICRYFRKVEHDRKLTGKAKGYLAVLIICIGGILAVTFTRIAPCAPEGIIRIGVCIYACLISMMLMSAMLQRSSLFALGALLFVFSDFILAWNKFVDPVPYSRYMILVPYFIGQWLLFIRSTPYRVGPEMRLMRF